MVRKAAGLLEDGRAAEGYIAFDGTAFFFDIREAIKQREGDEHDVTVRDF
jgi:hypothetical protein